MFDVDGSGTVKLGEMLRTVSKMRGEIQKSDMVASWSLLEGIREQLNEFQRLNIVAQRSILRAHEGENGFASEGPDSAEGNPNTHRLEERSSRRSSTGAHRQ